MSEKNSSTSDTSTINNGNIEGNNKEKKGVSAIDKKDIVKNNKDAFDKDIKNNNNNNNKNKLDSNKNKDSDKTNPNITKDKTSANDKTNTSDKTSSNKNGNNTNIEDSSNVDRPSEIILVGNEIVSGNKQKSSQEEHKNNIGEKKYDADEISNDSDSDIDIDVDVEETNNDGGMTQKARNAINGCCALIPWFFQTAVEWVQHMKGYFLTWTKVDFMFLILYTILFMCIFRVIVMSCIYLTIFLIGSPFSYGESSISVRGKKIILILLMVLSFSFFIGFIIYQMLLSLGVIGDVLGEGCSYMTPTMKDRPLLCMFGLEKVQGGNLILVLPEIAILIASCIGFGMVQKQGGEDTIQINANTQSSSFHRNEERTLRSREFNIVFCSFLACAVNPSLLTLPFLIFYVYCTLHWALENGSIHNSFVKAALPKGRAKRVKLWACINIYATIYTLAFYIYNMRGIPSLWFADILGFAKMRVFDGFNSIFVRFFPIAPLLPIVIISSLLWQSDSKNNKKKGEETHALRYSHNDVVNSENINIELTPLQKEKVDTDGEVKVSDDMNKVNDGNRTEVVDDGNKTDDPILREMTVVSKLAIEKFFASPIDFMLGLLTHPTSRDIICAFVLLLGPLGDFSYISLVYVLLLAIGLFYPKATYGKFMPYIITFTLIYMLTLYVGSAVDKLGSPNLPQTPGPLFDSGITWFPDLQIRFFNLMIVFTIFCSVWKASSGESGAQEREKIEEAFSVFFHDILEIYTRYYDMYRSVTVLTTFIMSYINPDILHLPLFIFGIAATLSKNGTSGLFFEYLWGLYMRYFVLILLIVSICTLSSLVPSLIAVENFIGFDELLLYNEQQVMIGNSTNTSAHTGNNTLRQFSYINKYSKTYGIGNKILIILGIGCGVVQLRILQRRIQEYREKRDTNMPCCGIGKQAKRGKPDKTQREIHGIHHNIIREKNILKPSKRESLENSESENSTLLNTSLSDIEPEDHAADIDTHEEASSAGQGSTGATIKYIGQKKYKDSGNDNFQHTASLRSAPHLEKLLSETDFISIIGTPGYKYVHMLRLPLFFLGWSIQLILMLLNIFHYPINIVGIVYMMCTIWMFMFPIIRESNKNLNSTKKQKKNGNLMLEFSQYVGDHSYRIALISGVISIMQYMFNISGTLKLKNTLEQDVLHSTLTLKNFGVTDLANKYPVWNIILTIISILLFRTPKSVFHLENVIDDANFNDDISKFYLDFILYLNMIMPYATSFFFAFVACIQPGLIGTVYLILSLYWLYLVYFSNTEVRVVTRIQLFLCCLSPLILFCVYVWQFPFFSVISSRSTEWVGLHRGKLVDGVHRWSTVVSLHFGLFICLSMQYLVKQLKFALLHETQLRKSHIRAEMQFRPSIASSGLKRRKKKNRKTEEMKKFEFENLLQIAALLKDWNIEICTICLLMCSILRGDMIGLVYLFVAFFMMKMDRWDVEFFWTVFFLIFTFIMLSQYVLRVGLPIDGFFNGYADYFAPAYVPPEGKSAPVNATITNSSLKTSSQSLPIGGISNATNATVSSLGTEQLAIEDERTKRENIYKSRALLRWLSIKVEDPIVLIYDLIILAMMTGIHGIFRFINNLSEDEKLQMLKLSYESYDFFLEGESLFSIKTWAHIFVQKDRENETIDRKTENELEIAQKDDLEEGVDKAITIIDKKQAAANRTTLEKNELIKLVGSISPQKEVEIRKKADKVLWTKKIENEYIVNILNDMADGSDVAKYAKENNIKFKKAKEDNNQKLSKFEKKYIYFHPNELHLTAATVSSHVTILHAYCRVVVAIIICIICGLNLNIISLVYLILAIVAATQEVIYVHKHNPMMIWRLFLSISFIFIVAREFFQMPLFEESTRRDSYSLLFGFQKSHNFFYGRYYIGSPILWIDWFIFLFSAILMRLSRSRMASYTSAKEEEKQTIADRIGDAAYLILELQRFFVLDAYQEEVKNIFKQVEESKDRRFKELEKIKQENIKHNVHRWSVAAKKHGRVGATKDEDGDKREIRKANMRKVSRTRTIIDDFEQASFRNHQHRNSAVDKKILALIDTFSSDGKKSSDGEKSDQKENVSLDVSWLFEADARTQFIRKVSGKLEPKRVAHAVGKKTSRFATFVANFLSYIPAIACKVSLPLVIFSMTLHYFVDVALYSMFYPIFVFCVVLLSNPQQLPIPTYGKEDAAVGEKTVNAIKMYYSETNSLTGNLIESRDGKHLESHLRSMEVYEHWQGNWERFLVASVEQTDENQANSMLLVGVIDLILNEAKNTVLADRNMDTSERMRREGRAPNTNSWVLLISRVFGFGHRQNHGGWFQTLDPYVQNISIRMWCLVLIWVSLHMVLQFAWQFPAVCACYTRWKPSNATHPYYIYSTYFNRYPYCSSSHLEEYSDKCQWIEPLPGQTNLSSYDKLFGITKVYEPLKIEEGDGKRILQEGLDGKYFSSIVLDLFVFVCVLLHISVLKHNGAESISKHIRTRYDDEGNEKKPRNCCKRIYGEVVHEFMLNIHTSYINDEYKTRRTKPGYDFYGQIFSWQLVLFMYVFFYEITDINVIIQGGFSIRWAYRVIFVVFCIVIDRMIYMWRLAKWKLAFHLFQICFFLALMHSEFGPTVLSRRDLPIWRQTIIVIYFPYFYYSSLQISYGYPPFVGEPLLLKHESFADSIMWYIYRLVPLIYELKVLLDWYCVDTTLWLYDSIKFEDIRQTLFLVGCAIDYYEREDVRDRGTRQIGKFLLGLLSFIGILLVMFTPFLVFSFTSVSLAGTPVTTVSVKLGVVGYPPLYRIDELPLANATENNLLEAVEGDNIGCTDKTFFPDSPDPPSTYACLQQKYWSLKRIPEFAQEAMQRREGQLLYVPWTSGTNWPITSLKRVEMLEQLLGRLKETKLFLQFTFLRADKKTFTYRKEDKLIEHIYDIETTSTGSLKKNYSYNDLYQVITGEKKDVLIKNFFPRFLRLPLSGDVIEVANMDGMQDYRETNQTGFDSDMYLQCLLTMGTPETIPWNESITTVTTNVTSSTTTSTNNTNATSNATEGTTTTTTTTVQNATQKATLDSAEQQLTEMLDTLRKQLLVSWSLQCGSDEAHLKKLSPATDNTKGLIPGKNYEFFVFSSKDSAVSSVVDTSSIIPLFFLCFVTIGGFIRVFFTGTQLWTPFVDMPKIYYLKKYITNIDLARQIANMDDEYLRRLKPDGETDFVDLSWRQKIKQLKKREKAVYGKILYKYEEMTRDEDSMMLDHYRQLTADFYRQQGLEAEEELYRELLDIYRQPEKLHELTGPAKHWWGADTTTIDSTMGNHVIKEWEQFKFKQD